VPRPAAPPASDDGRPGSPKGAGPLGASSSGPLQGPAASLRAVGGRGSFSFYYRYWPVFVAVSMARPDSLPLPLMSVRM
jgi:hypothetical protein